jgi:citrate lyase subunit beta/citryl-CoA lyase
MNSSLRHCRSLIFLPASNPRAIEKARGLEADMVILDLEDAVKPADKGAARSLAIEATRAGFGDRLSAIRVNAVDTRYHDDDLACVRESAADYVVLAKAQRVEEVTRTATATEKPILAMIETPRAVLGAAKIAPQTQGLIAGTNDLSAELGLRQEEGRQGLVHALQAVVLAARAAGIAAFDGVYNRLEDDDGLVQQCLEGRAYGFDGKSLIHPSQIATANRLFGPSDEEVEAARRLVAAATGGAERFEGRMIEALHVDQARAILAKARRG